MNTATDKQNKRFTVFTLIELLVVIAIIAILAAILMPGLQNARTVARKAACASNLKQFGIVFTAYSSDFNNYLPCLNYGTSWTNYVQGGWWSNILINGGYLPTPKWSSGNQAEKLGGVATGVWRCPEFYDNMINWGGGLGVLENSTHGMSYATYPHLSRYKRTSQVFLMGDSWNGSTHMSLMALNCPICAAWNGSNWHEVAPVHKAIGNILYYDGHVGNVKYGALLTNQNDIFGHYNR